MKEEASVVRSVFPVPEQVMEPLVSRIMEQRIGWSLEAALLQPEKNAPPAALLGYVGGAKP